MTQATMDETVAPLWSDSDIITLYQNAFGKSPDVYHMAFVRWIRDDMQTTIATQATQLEEQAGLMALVEMDNARLVKRIEALTQRIDDLMGIGSTYLEQFTKTELERYAQTSPPEMFRNYLNAQADNERLRRELAGVLDVAIARGENLNFDSDDDYRSRYRELTEKGWDDAAE